MIEKRRAVLINGLLSYRIDIFGGGEIDVVIVDSHAFKILVLREKQKRKNTYFAYV